MKSPEDISKYYFHQGFNYAEYTPDGITRFGGGCQASSLLIATRLLLKNPSYSMENLKINSEALGLAFHDINYSTRISYASIPLLAAMILPDHNVSFSCKLTTDEINKQEQNTFYGNEAHFLYQNMPKINNLSSNFNISIDKQIVQIKNAIKNGGVAIPLFHTNTLLSSDNPVTEKLFHAVVLVELSDDEDSVRIIDPSPGFSNAPAFERLRDENKLKIRANSIKSFSSIQSIANKFHPLKSVDYVLPFSIIERAIRSVSTTIEPS